MVRVHGALMAMIVAVDVYRSTGALPRPIQAGKDDCS